MGYNKSMRKTAPTIERDVIKLIALGERYADIAARTGVRAPTIKKIRKRNIEAIDHLKARALETQAQQISSLVSRTNAQIKAQLDQAERDWNKLEELAELYREGEISRNEYYRRKRGLKNLSIRELITISNAMHDQVNNERRFAPTH